MATTTRKPSPAQARALTWLVEVKNGRAGWSTWSDDALAFIGERTWYACERAGWVTLVRDLEICRFPLDVVVTDAGRRAVSPGVDQ